MLFKQLFDDESSTFTYLIADTSSREAALIDPVKSQLEIYKALLDEYGLNLKYSLETHVHADHITASGILRQQLGCQTGVGHACEAKNADKQIHDHDAFHLGDKETITAIATPGHTKGSMAFQWRDKVFTGDALLINGCGRTDFQGGNAGTLYDSITQRLFSLPDETLVFPGHDYKGHSVSSIGQEKRINPRVAGKSKEEFIELMNNLNLPKPKLIDIAVPANRYCGVDEEETFQSSEPRDATKSKQRLTAPQIVAQIKPQITEVTPEDTRQLIQNENVILIDIREESEVAKGSINGAEYIPRGVLEFKISELDIPDSTEAKVILYCRSGGRSALAAASLQNMGFKNIMSMKGGYEAWKSQQN
tara:strand:+ start:20047 stop:21135 length:1089 start_codon:yes stop_codon:yes gene_type:complete